MFFEKLRSKKIAKTVSAVTTGTLAVGAAEQAVVAKDRVSDSNARIVIEQEAKNDYAKEEMQRMENKFGIKLTPSKIDEAEEKERDYTEDFNLGMESSKVEDCVEMKYARELAADDQNYLDNEGSLYKVAAFEQMINKYGKERFSVFVKILQNIYPEEGGKPVKDALKAYSFALPQLGKNLDPEKKEKLNKKLYNVAYLLTEGGIEKLGKLFEFLRKEGYDKAYDFSWSEKQIDRLLNDPEERKAFIEFTSKVNIFKYSEFKDYLGGDDAFSSMTYIEKLKAYESFLKLKE